MDWRNRSAFLAALVGTAASAALLLPALASAATLAQANTSALTNGLVGYWPLDGDTTNWGTGTAYDLSGNGYTGSLIGMSTSSSPVQGKIGQALQFNGTNQQITYSAAASAILGTGNSSISVWVYSAGSPAVTASPINSESGQIVIGDQNVDFWISRVADSSNANADSICVGFYNGTTLNNKGVCTPMTTSKWNCVTFVLSSGTVTGYLNGSSFGSVANGSGISFTSGSKLGIGSHNTVANSYWSGSIDDVRIYNRALSPTEVALLYAAGQAHVGSSPTNALTSGLVGYWTMDGRQTHWNTGTEDDLSGNGNNGHLINMSTSSSPVAGKIGQALAFNSNLNNYLQLASTTATSMNANFTLSAWMYPTGSVGGALISKGASYSVDGQYVLSTNMTQPYASVTLYVSDGTSYASCSTSYVTAPLPLNNWYHITAVSSATTIYLYVNGVLKSTCDRSSIGTTFTGDSWFAIGRRQLNLYTFTGALDDVRIYNRALSSTEVAQLYADGAVKADHSVSADSGGPLTNGLVGYWTFDGPTINWSTGTVADKSGNGNTGSLINMSTTSSPTQGKIGQALKFDGSTQRISVANTAALNPTSAVSVSAWVKFNNFSGKQAVVTKWDDTHGNYRTYALGMSSGYLNFYLSHDGTIQVSTGVLTSSLRAGVWYHVVGTFDGTTMKMYLNGVATTPVSSPGSINTNSYPLYIGGGYFGGLDSYLNGSVDDVRIYSRALSASEVQQLYNIGK